MERCKQCKKVLFKKKDGTLVCPNECNENYKRSAFNTVMDPWKDRRGNDQEFDPWGHGR